MITRIARTHRAQLLVSYSLTAAAHLVGQLYPLATAVAINGVIRGEYAQAGWLLACHLLMMGLEISARLYDTRVFTRIYANLACQVVLEARAVGIDSSIIAGRAALSREYVEFLERDLPSAVSAIIALLVALAVLLGMDAYVGLACLLLIAPLAAINHQLLRRSVRINRRLNDRLEREVIVLREGRLESVRRHFSALGGWRVRLSDAEAKAFGLMELCVVALIAAALVRLSLGAPMQAGDVYAVFAYVWRFVFALDQVPPTIQRLATLGDLNRRMATQEYATTAAR